jgi:hypothetical protein
VPSQVPYGYQPVPAVAPRKRRPTALWVAIGVVLLLVVGGGVFVVRYLLPIENERHAHVTTPDTIGELTRSTDPQDLATAATLKGDLPPAAEGAVAAVYNDSVSPTRGVAVVAATGAIDDPARVADEILSGSPDEQLTDIRTVDAGALSGIARCGDGRASNGSPLEACTWVDHGSLGLVVMVGWDRAAAEDLFRQVRAAVLTRG